MLLLGDQVIAQYIDYPDFGPASLTHYDLPTNFVAACGCTPESTHYPTAALSQLAYGSSEDYGPACGRCFNLTLLSPVIATPPFHPSVVKHIVVKITDLCPLSKSGYCSGTTTKPNSAGDYINFDLAFPSVGIPTDFFPSNVSLYGYTDFGVWNITYQVVSCSNWAGFSDPAALGSVGQGTCCPDDPTPGNASNICPSFSDNNGIPPDTINGAPVASFPPFAHLLMLATFFLLMEKFT